MRPPYSITSEIVRRIAAISEKIGEVNAHHLNKPSPQLRKQNRIKTIQSSLRIEGNTLSEEQVTALVENKPVLGPKKDVIEVVNAIKVYDMLDGFIPHSEKSFLGTHGVLMDCLIAKAGKYRKQGVGIVKGGQVAHIAPPYENVPFLMKELFRYLKRSDELALIKACAFHYELAFIHPFMDGNGRMARLWQTRILMEEYPVFEFLPFESLISRSQKEYYEALSVSDKSGDSTFFIEYMLGVMDHALASLLQHTNRLLKDVDRLNYFLSLGKKEFTRKEYRAVFKHLSSATASRDLKKGVELGLIASSGSLNQTKYKLHLTH